MKAVTLFPVVVLIAACNVAPSKVTVVFFFGVEARNVLDTQEGTFTKDMVMDPPVTVPLQLTPEELTRIAQKARSTGFFAQPRHIEKSDCGRISFPESSFCLRIRSGHHDHTVSWTSTCEPDSLKDLREMIVSLITSKEAYKRLPRPRGGYQ
jgi:hypothetical protein